MPDKFSTIYIWITLLVSAGAIAVMLLLGKPEAQEHTQNPEPSEVVYDHKFYEATEELPENGFKIILPEDTKEQHITIENDYMNKTIRISVAKQPEGEFSQDYFYGYPIQFHARVGEPKLVEDAEKVTVSFPLDSMFEWEMKLEKENGQNCMYVQLVRPRDKYERIVVLDAGHGGADAGNTVSGEDESVLLVEKDLALAVVEKTGRLLEKEGIQVYYTREDDANPSQQARVGLANETQADMLISVHADYADDTNLYGMRTIYNETYFIPNFASSDLAYLLLEKVALSTNEKAIGFEPGTGDIHLVQNAMVPVAQLYIGYLSNKQEQKLLGREDYIDRIAAGIYDAVLAGYEEIEK